MYMYMWSLFTITTHMYGPPLWNAFNESNGLNQNNLGILPPPPIYTYACTCTCVITCTSSRRFILFRLCPIPRNTSRNIPNSFVLANLMFSRCLTANKDITCIWTRIIMNFVWILYCLLACTCTCKPLFSYWLEFYQYTSFYHVTISHVPLLAWNNSQLNIIRFGNDKVLFTTFSASVLISLSLFSMSSITYDLVRTYPDMASSTNPIEE